jgi:hypothetical protein
VSILPSIHAVKASGSTQSPKEVFAGLDWSRVRDIDGKETVVNKPFSFPLSVGKAWEVRYVPEVRRWVKSVEEYYGNGGVRNERYTGELESLKLAE